MNARRVYLKQTTLNKNNKTYQTIRFMISLILLFLLGLLGSVVMNHFDPDYEKHKEKQEAFDQEMREAEQYESNQ